MGAPKTQLRPLTDAQSQAALLRQKHTPMAQVERETGLTPAQIIAAVDLQGQWQRLHEMAANGSGPTRLDKAGFLLPSKPATPTFQAAQGAPVAPAVIPAEPDPIVGEAAVAVLDEPAPLAEIDVPVYAWGDANATLARAEKSDDAGILDAAREIRALLTGLDKRMDVSEKTAATRARVDMLQMQLADALAELADLAGEDAPPVVPEPADAADGEPEWTTAEIRAWARRKHIAIANRGRIPADLVKQFLIDRAKASK